MAQSGFDPAMDRYDRDSAARLFQSLWPDLEVARAIADNIAVSVRAAHAAAEASWSLTMYPNSLRLNVGQVETLTIWDTNTRILFCAPLPLDFDERFDASDADEPFYRSVPVASGVCEVPTSLLSEMPTSLREAHDAYIRAAASFKRKSPFKRSFSPSILEHIESILGIELPRPSYFAEGSSVQNATVRSGSHSEILPLLEGSQYETTVSVYERNPQARALCIAEHGTNCSVCGFSFGAKFGAIAEGFIHVHHLRPLSEIGEEYEVDPIEHLRPVCPNCHAVLHRRIPAFTIEELQAIIGHNK